MDHAPPNLAVFRHMALNLVRKEPNKESLRRKIKRTGWHNDYLAKLLALL